MKAGPRGQAGGGPCLLMGPRCSGPRSSLRPPRAGQTEGLGRGRKQQEGGRAGQTADEGQGGHRGQMVTGPCSRGRRLRTHLGGESATSRQADGGRASAHSTCCLRSPGRPSEEPAQSGAQGRAGSHCPAGPPPSGPPAPWLGGLGSSSHSPEGGDFRHAAAPHREGTAARPDTSSHPKRVQGPTRQVPSETAQLSTDRSRLSDGTRRVQRSTTQPGKGHGGGTCHNSGSLDTTC